MMTSEPKERAEPVAGPIRSASMGAIFALDAAGMCLALAAICFAGPLGAGQGLGTSVFALATALTTVLIFWLGQFRMPFAIAQDTSIAILAPAVALVGLAVEGPVEAKVATALALLGTTAALSGLAFWLMGRLRMGRLLRMFPYPVSAGFLSSSGILLILAGCSVVTETMQPAQIIASLGEDNVARNLGIALVFATVLMLTMRAGGGALGLLIMMLAFMALIYLFLFWYGIEQDAAVALGLLPEIALNPSAAIAPSLSLIPLIDWWAVLTVAPVIAAVVVMNVIGMILNTTGVEMATRSDIDIDRELRLTGMINIGIGGLGAISSYIQGGTTMIMDKIGVAPRAAIFGHTVVMIIAMGFAGLIVANVPTVFIAGLLIFVGASMVDDWLIAGLRRLPREDMVIVLGIVLVTLVFGILPAIAVGLLLALLGFAYGYAKMPLVRQATTALHRPSILDRSPAEAEILTREAGGIRILHLHGALFFGSVEQLIDLVRAEQARDGGLTGLILDVTDVTRFDGSVPTALSKLAYLFGDLNVGLHLCGLPAEKAQSFARWGLPIAAEGRMAPGHYRLWDALDEAIEHCEDRLLARHMIFQPTKDITGILEALLGPHPRLPDLTAAMQQHHLAQGEALVHRDDAGQDVFFVETGRLGAFLTGSDAEGLRVRSMGPGAVVGELAHILKAPRSADVIAEAPSSVWRLSQATMERFDTTDPELAALKNLALARALGLKVLQTNALLTYARYR